MSGLLKSIWVLDPAINPGGRSDDKLDVSVVIVTDTRM